MQTARLALAIALLLAASPPARAAITCDQLASVAYSTQQARDKGATLSDLLVEADQLAKHYSLTPAELDGVKGVIGSVYKGSRNWMDIMEACKRAARPR